MIFSEGQRWTYHFLIEPGKLHNIWRQNGLRVPSNNFRLIGNQVQAILQHVKSGIRVVYLRVLWGGGDSIIRDMYQ